MAGYIRGSHNWNQRMLGMFVNAAKNMRARSTDNYDDLVVMITAFGNIYDVYTGNDGTPMREAITGKVFD